MIQIRGLDIPLPGAPRQAVAAGAPVLRLALTGVDHHGLRPSLLVQEGEVVAAGAALFADRARPALHFTAPVAGRVEKIALAPRRVLDAIILVPQDGPSRRFDTSDIRLLLLEAGLWPAFRTRPFDRIPDPQTRPAAIFVTAIDTNPHAPDPAMVLAGREGMFARGLTALEHLTEGPVHLCQGLGPALAQTGGRIRLHRFRGAHPAGLAGTHIARLHPAAGEAVWHIGYQDVAAIGHLLSTGHVDGMRIIALSGPGVRDPRLVRVPLGADIHALARPDLTPGQKTILSGPALSGRPSRWLGRHHLQVTVMDQPAPRPRNWLLAALERASAPAPFIPTMALDHALGPALPIVPLLRALSVGDSDAARQLGCLQLAEEDLALATYVTGGVTDFAARLRDVLNTLEEEA